MRQSDLRHAYSRGRGEITPHSNRSVGLRAVALFEAAKGIIVLLLGCGLLALLRRNLDESAEQITGFLHVNPAGKLSKVFLNLADRTTSKTVWLLAIGALVYAAVRITEAYGLWRQREWAQWFALLSGALYLPGELYSLLQHASRLKSGVLAANVLVILFMLSLRIKAVRMPGPAYFGRAGSFYGAED